MQPRDTENKCTFKFLHLIQAAPLHVQNYALFSSLLQSSSTRPFQLCQPQKICIKDGFVGLPFLMVGSGFLSRIHLHTRDCQCVFSVANRSFLQLTDTDRSNTTHSSPLTAGLEIPALTAPKPNFPNPLLQPQSPTMHKQKSKSTLQTCCLNDFQYHFLSAISLRVTGLDTDTKTAN